MKKNIKLNFIYQAFYEVLVLILPLITSPYVSRVLGAEKLGVHSFTFTIANYFVLFSALGIRNYGNREIARNRDNKEQLQKTFCGILYLHIIISAIVIIGYCIYTIWFAKKEYKIIAIIQGIYVIGALLDISWFFFGLEEFKMTVTRNTIIKLISVIAIFVFVKNPSDLYLYSLFLALANIFGQVYLWLYVRKYVSFCKVSFSQMYKHLPQMAILFIPTIAISLYNYMDKIMVGELSGNIQLAFYDNSEKIISVASNLVGSVGTVMLPRMSNIVAKNDWKNGKKYIRNSMEAVLFMSCALCFGLAGISHVFSTVFWGEQFTACSSILILLVAVLPIKGFANILRTQYLIPLKRDKQYTLSVCIGAIVNLVFNSVLIPRYQAVGASIGTILAELSVCFVQIIFCKSELDILDYLKTLLRYSVVGIVMFAVVFTIGSINEINVSTLIIQIITGVIVYSVICFVYLKLTKNPILSEFIKKTNR